MTCKRIRHRCNTAEDIRKAFADGYDGVEVDLTWADDPHGDIWLEHAHRAVGEHLLLSEALELIPDDKIIALNVKEYGMSEWLWENLKGFPGLNYFVFDVPGPELQEYRSLGLKYLGRRSEFEMQHSPYGSIVDSEHSDADFAMEALHSNSALISPTLRGLPEWENSVLEGATWVITK